MEPDVVVSIAPETRDDLMALATITRRDHRELLAEAVEAVRTRHLPRVVAVSAVGGRGRPRKTVD